MLPSSTISEKSHLFKAETDSQTISLADHPKKGCSSPDIEISQSLAESFIEIIDFNCQLQSDTKNNSNAGQKITHCQLSTSAQIRSYLQNGQNKKNGYSTRVISLFQTHSWAPLDVSDDMVQSILSYYNVAEDFSPLLNSFYVKTMEVEDAFMVAPWKRTHQVLPDGGLVYEMGYILKYPEMKVVDTSPGATTWVIRQTGVYQRVEASAEKNTFILLHPSHTSAARRGLRLLLNSESEAVLSAKEMTKENANPLQLHIFIFGTYLYNWRAYMKQQEEALTKASYGVLCIEIEEDLPFAEMYETLSNLEDFERHLAPLKSIFTATVRTLQMLQKINHLQTHPAQESIAERLENYEAMLNGFDDNLLYLLDRIRSISALLSNTISLKNENTSNSISRSMLKYNRFTVDDSATVRVITLVTLMYLPSSWVSDFFSMGAFFTVQNAGSSPSQSSMFVTPAIWVYFALAIPLTALTVAYWWWRSKMQSLKTHADDLV